MSYIIRGTVYTYSGASHTTPFHQNLFSDVSVYISNRCSNNTCSNHTNAERVISCENKHRWMVQKMPVCKVLVRTTRPGFTMRKSIGLFSKFLKFKGYFTNYLTDTRHVCTYLNVFLMVNPNINTKVKNVDPFFWKFCEILTCRHLLSYDMPAASLNSKQISQITKPILGMFVLIWMHFSWCCESKYQHKI